MSGCAVVTGGGSGIGAGIAVGLLEDGYTVVVFERDAAAVRLAEQRFGARGLSVDCRRVDVGDPAQVAAAVTAVVDTTGPPDVLVNCAGITGVPAKAGFLETTDEQVTRIMAVNAIGPFVCAREVARHMVARGSGVIVNIGSIAAYRGQLDASAYTMSKSALAGLTRSLALELGPHGIRVVQVDPGDIVTPASERLMELIRADRARSGVTDDPPIGRRGVPADIAEAVRFVCSPRAGFVSGTTIVVDGGYLAG